MPAALKYVSSAFIKKHRAAIGSAIRERAEEWGLRGWSVFGTNKSRLRIAVRVPVRRVSPPNPATHITIAKTRIKLSVVPSFAWDLPREVVGNPIASGAMDFPLAPGAPISIEGKMQCGIGAILAIDDVPHIVTCSHAFDSGDTNVRRFDTNKIIAKRAYDLFGSPFYLDAVACELTPLGLSAANESAQASTWASAIHEPATTDNDQACVLWPTHEQRPSPIDLSVFSAMTDFFPFNHNPNGPSPFIEVQYAARGGDSGGPLMIDDAYYGICRGTDSQYSFFTPMAAIAAALRSDGKKVKPWKPA